MMYNRLGPQEVMPPCLLKMVHSSMSGVTHLSIFELPVFKMLLDKIFKTEINWKPKFISKINIQTILVKFDKTLSLGKIRILEIFI